jgi:hypothetical protein
LSLKGTYLIFQFVDLTKNKKKPQPIVQ